MQGTCNCTHANHAECKGEAGGLLMAGAQVVVQGQGSEQHSKVSNHKLDFRHLLCVKGFICMSVPAHTVYRWLSDTYDLRLAPGVF